MRGKITDYFSKINKGLGDDQTAWLNSISESARSDYNNKTGVTLNERIQYGMKSGEYWNKSNEVKNKVWLEEQHKTVRNRKMDTPPLQDTGELPILFGSDVVGLYPNLDGISVGALTFKAVKRTSIKFTNIKFSLLMIYLTLVLGQKMMIRHGLEKCIPVRKTRGRDPKSLTSDLNKDLDNWDFSKTVTTDDNKTTMVALMVQIMVMLMTSTTCYTFAGNIYRQKNGLGIGLRGSAALARLTMCMWDSSWGTMQRLLGLKLKLFFRYVDDIRLYLYPISRGWFWDVDKWSYDINRDDKRSADQRTIEEVGKSLEAVWKFLKFTCESEKDFENGFLPTLDFETRVKSNGSIEYKFFSKPMANNLVLQCGTGLSKVCIFSSLRQELVRRLLNTDLQQNNAVRVALVEQFIQLMINSDHKYTYIKSVVMQGLTKYLYMVQRDGLPVTHKKYKPLHRSRTYDQHQRKLLKYVNSATWYTDLRLGDKYKDKWKGWIVRKENRATKTDCTRTQAKKHRVPTTTTLFVPKTRGSKLLDMVIDSQSGLDSKVGWKMKILEKPGLPLFRKFSFKFPMRGGVP